MRDRLHLGIDVGSASANTIIMNDEKDILFEEYTRTKGQPLETVARVLGEVLSRFSTESMATASFTGSGGKLLAKLLKTNFTNEIIAQSRAIAFLHPEVRTVIEMGGEYSKLIILKNTNDGMEIEDFAMNTLCAAGTGSFLDQQAARLGLSIEEFSRMALESKSPPRIAGRCSVFAKSDMIHLQQEATPVCDIVAGLCYAMARNLKGNIGKGKKFHKPISFQGGVAANLGVRRAFSDILGLEDGELIIPKYFLSMGAVGAILLTLEDPNYVHEFQGIGPLLDYIKNRSAEVVHHKPLRLPDPGSKIPAGHVRKIKRERTRAFLGIDVGSISTNLVALDENKRVLAKRYLMTAGRPLDAVKQGLKELGEELGDLVEIIGIGTTGSGRYLTGDFVGADVIVNEITAQATAAADIDPEVDTIFEIGGQDSKYISLQNGAIVDFQMNKVCAAGTGSFLEEQADQLSVSIRHEFGSLALESKTPVPLGERCTVFMKSDLVHHQQRGAERADLVAGLSYAIVQNYLNKVVEDRKIGKKIFYQGGTAANLGIVSAFESVLDREIIVPEHHEVTGAIGVAILAQRERVWEKSKFKGFMLSERKYTTDSFECKSCPNRCEIKRVRIEGEKPLFYGSRCEKYDVGHEADKGAHLPDLFKERTDWLFENPPSPSSDKEGKGRFSAKKKPKGRIGIPRTLYMYELFPYWRAFFENLGFTVVLSDATHKQMIHKGLEQIVSETCYPIKVAHGHVLDLIEKGVDYVFLPSIIEMKSEKITSGLGFVCPYNQALPYLMRSAIDVESRNVQVLQPILRFDQEGRQVRRALQKMGADLGISLSGIEKACAAAEKAQSQFYKRTAARGREILESIPPGQKAIIVLGRPYTACDPGINLNVAAKLKKLGILAIPMDFLPLDDSRYLEPAQTMYWRYGQKILSAAELMRDNPNLYAVYLTYFACGPDSFILHFFRESLKGKSYLEIEIDEHSADAGVLTRLEAYLDSLKYAVPARDQKTVRKKVFKAGIERKMIYIPPMADHSYAIAAAFEACGARAEVLPRSDEETLRWGRKLTSSKECYPLILTTGDMAKMVHRSDFYPDKSAFFMPSGNGPCRFGHYHSFHRMILDSLGFPQVPIFAPNQDETFYDRLGMVGKDFPRLGWQGIVAVDLLEKKLREVRPYEKRKGEADAVYRHSLQEVCGALRERKPLSKTLAQARRDFDHVTLNGFGEKPIIGIVGEIYIRSNEYSNEGIVRQIESLGGEAWLPTISEWILYINYTAKRRSRRERKFKDLLRLSLEERFQLKDEHRMSEVFNGGLRNFPEPKIEDLLSYAQPYIDSSFEGEAVLSVGKAHDFLAKKASGIVNVMPFTCMPGTIVSTILKRFREQHDNIPFLAVSYDGQGETNTRTRLEAFMYQVGNYRTSVSKRG
ncbi:MAG: acyl-CoA dehydratase activase [Pseudomonadota bacterium]